jgi:hypothetical protein
MATMPIAMVTQFSVTIPDKPGELARLTGLLSDAGVNLAGIATFSLGKRASVRFLAGKRRHLKQRLEAAGYLIVESSAFQIRLGSKPDAFHRLMSELGARGVTVTSCYGQSDKGGTIVLSVDRPHEAAPIIARCHTETSTSAALSFA